MSFSFDFGIFGGDLRQVYIASELLSRGYSISIYEIPQNIHHEKAIQAHSLSDLFETCRVIIGPIPMTRDQITITSGNAPSDLTLATMLSLLKEDHILFGGAIPSSVKDQCRAKNIIYCDFMDSEKITILNAIATAEGTIMEAIAASDRNLHRSRCLVLGYGRCAKVLAQKLKALDAKVIIAARSEESLAYAEAAGLNTIQISNIKTILPSVHFIFNTIPALILDKECLELVDRKVTIIDIASSPGGVDFEYAKQSKLNAKLCLGLPGKIAPRSSANFLVTEILTFMNERKK